MDTAYRVDFNVVADKLINQIRVVAQRAGEFVDRRRAGRRVIDHDSTRCGDARTTSLPGHRLFEALQVDVGRAVLPAPGIKRCKRFNRTVGVDICRQVTGHLPVVRCGVGVGDRRHERPDGVRLRRELFLTREASAHARLPGGGDGGRLAAAANKRRLLRLRCIHRGVARDDSGHSPGKLHIAGLGNIEKQSQHARHCRE